MRLRAALDLRDSDRRPSKELMLRILDQRKVIDAIRHADVVTTRLDPTAHIKGRGGRGGRVQPLAQDDPGEVQL